MTDTSLKSKSKTIGKYILKICLINETTTHPSLIDGTLEVAAYPTNLFSAILGARGKSGRSIKKEKKKSGVYT